MTSTATAPKAAATLPEVDFLQPAGEPALAGPDSVSWRVFKNLVALYIGGIAAVLLELAEPRVRSGVWDHTTFRTDPLTRMQRTGIAAMVTVYGARSVAQQMIRGITKMHARVQGETPDGRSYRALEPELMNWVQVTASYGFLQAYHQFVTPLSAADRDRFYADAQAGAKLYGAPGAPANEAQQQALFAHMLPQLEASDIVFEFLDIMRRTGGLPPLMRPLQPLFLRAAISILPEPVRVRLNLDKGYRLAGWERLLVRGAGALSDRIVLRSAPPAQACLRLGLPADYLYK
ncbi:MAG: DUF2236 domain-containing protein [Haliea sp.]|nr:DUF2236 domain-containing protein [Haliea sp.]